MTWSEVSKMLTSVVWEEEDFGVFTPANRHEKSGCAEVRIPGQPAWSGYKPSRLRRRGQPPTRATNVQRPTVRCNDPLVRPRSRSCVHGFVPEAEHFQALFRGGGETRLRTARTCFPLVRPVGLMKPTETYRTGRLLYWRRQLSG